jgi:hypothetical protein
MEDRPMTLGRRAELAQRREALLIRSTALRSRLAEDVASLSGVAGLVDTAWAACTWLRRHPLPVASGLGLLALWRPRRLLRLARGVWTGWRWWRRLKPALKTLSVLAQARRSR